MKKALSMLLLLVSFFSQADAIDGLDKAVREGNIQTVKTLLQEAPIFSDSNMLSFIDLSQQMIDYHKGQLECHQVSFQERWTKQVLYLKSGSFFLLPVILHIGATLCSPKFPKKNILLNSVTCSSLAISAIFFKCFANYWNRFKKLKRNFDNAVAIKQHLLRHTSKCVPAYAQKSK